MDLNGKLQEESERLATLHAKARETLVAAQGEHSKAQLDMQERVLALQQQVVAAQLTALSSNEEETKGNFFL